MPRKPHYWKPAKSSAAPSNIIVVDTETWFGPSTAVNGVERHTLRLGHALAYRLEKGKRTRVRELDFTEAGQFWAFVKSRQDSRRPLWVFAHNAGYDLGILDGWSYIKSPAYSVDRCAISATMLWVKGATEDGTLNFCDTGNYYHCSLEAVGKAVGLPKQPMPPQDAPDSEWLAYCRNDVQVTALGLDMLIEFVRGNALGPWQPTIAGLAFSGYRRSFLHKEVLVHCHKPVLEMERAAYCGGAVDTNYIGRVPDSPIFELDVCSMYPSQCCLPLPKRLLGYTRRVSPTRLMVAGQSDMVIADVDISSSSVGYPVKTTAGTIYPVGKYRTTLAHPELMSALQAGHITRVHAAAFYEPACIFQGYMQWFAAKKIAYNEVGNGAFETICKYYLNSLYGKTGQLTPVWQEWGRHSLQVIEEQHGLKHGALSDYYDKPPRPVRPDWHWICQDKGIQRRVRNTLGICEIQVGHTEARDSCPAIAACVTSYARLLLRSYQTVAGRRNWFYSDTDSVWVNSDGLARLQAAGMIKPKTLGKLDVKKRYECLTVYGPKDYVADEVIKLKGIKLLPDLYIQPGDSCTEIRVGNKKLYYIRTTDGKYRQTSFASAKHQIAHPTPGVVEVAIITKALSRAVTACTVGPDGWTQPLQLPDQKIMQRCVLDHL